MWLEKTEAVNAVGVAYHTVQEVRDKCKNLTSTAKKEFSDFGKEQRGELKEKVGHFVSTLIGR